MPFSADALELFVNNDQPMHKAVTRHILALRDLLSAAAVAVAKANRDWHDDPSAEDHAEYHAPADVQFPREVRDEAVRNLVAYYLNEWTINPPKGA